MIKIKSFSVGNGDMFYVKHGSSNFSIIDCCLSDDDKEHIVDELIQESSGKDITRFISTHPDDDHIKRIEYLDSRKKIWNFYCVQNDVTKEDETDSFNHYCELRDDSSKSFYLSKGCTRKWMNQGGKDDNEKYIGSSGISILWPIVNNGFFITELENTQNGESPNNISPIIEYSVDNGISVLWMGDLETEFMENIINEVSIPKINILFAPHHGRKSGKVPNEWLEDMNPDIIIMGEAPSLNLDYSGYNNYNKITQNTAGDIIFDCDGNKIHIYVSKENYSVDFLDNEYLGNNHDCYYLGTLNI